MRYNQEHAITPRTIQKRISSLRDSIWEQDYVTVPTAREQAEPPIPAHELTEFVASLRAEMREAAEALDFERAAELRDRIRELELEQLRMG
jgi:excinuclease ABC subunit B